MRIIRDTLTGHTPPIDHDQWTKRVRRLCHDPDPAVAHAARQRLHDSRPDHGRADWADMDWLTVTETWRRLARTRPHDPTWARTSLGPEDDPETIHWLAERAGGRLTLLVDSPLTGMPARLLTITI